MTHQNLMLKHELNSTTPTSIVTTFKEPSVIPSTSTANVTMELSESGSDCDPEKVTRLMLKTHSLNQPL